MSNSKRKIKVAGYIRVSTLDQVREGASLKVQENSIRSYASAHRFDLVKVCRDEGVSGANVDRPGLDKLREDARAGKFEIVIFKSLSRFGRNAMDLLSLYKEFEDDYSIELISIDEGIKTTTGLPPV